MSSPACGSCAAPVLDGYLCSGCTRDLAELLLLAASISADLDDAVARQLRRGSGGRRSETEAPLPVDLKAAARASDLAICLRYWTRELHGQAAGTAQMARWLVAHLAEARQRQDANMMLGAIRTTVGRALEVIDRRPDRVPAGLCDNCGRQLLAELGAESVTCGCGMTALALQDKRRERAAAADVLGTAAEISGALGRIGIRIPRGTITSWASRGRLAPRPGGVYALSDVLALHAQSQARVRG